MESWGLSSFAISKKYFYRPLTTQKNNNRSGLNALILQKVLLRRDNYNSEIARITLAIDWTSFVFAKIILFRLLSIFEPWEMIGWCFCPENWCYVSHSRNFLLLPDISYRYIHTQCTKIRLCCLRAAQKSFLRLEMRRLIESSY